MAEIAALLPMRAPLTEDEFTAQMLADAQGIEKRSVLPNLNRLVKEGVLTVRSAVHEGHEVKAYRRAQNGHS